MGVEKHLDLSSSASTRLNKSHSVDIYRPPALRRNLESVDNEHHNQQQLQPKQQEAQEHLQPLQPNDKNCISAKFLPSTNSDVSNQVDNCCNDVESATKASSSASVSNQRQVRRERRPDRAVYIPRARRSQTTPPSVSTQLPTHQPSPQQHATPVTENNHQLTSLTATSSLNNGIVNNTAAHTISTASACTSPLGVKSTNRRSNKDRLGGTCNRKEKSSSKRLSIGENEKPNIHNINNSINHHNSEAEPVTINRELRKQSHESRDRSGAYLNGLLNSDDKNLLLVKDCDISNPKEFFESTNLVNIKKSVNIAANDAKGRSKMANTPVPALVAPVDKPEDSDNLRIEDALLSGGEKLEKCDRDAEELLRASKEINRSNRRIMKQTFNSDVLEIPEKTVLNSYSSNKNNAKDDCKHVNAAKSGTDDDQTEDDDWDSMYDDSGDCLDPKILQELTASVGKVKIEMPKMDYSAYLTKQSILNEEEFPHVLEVSNFPVEFKNQDLLMVFSQYKESGFDIKWVDDTHALAVFSSSQIAAEVLTKGHPFVVLKPLAEATVESRLKAKKCSASLQPYRPRPETCAALARRLVTGALGVRLKTAPQERENEKRVLREAKERKLLAAKQRDEAWES